MNDNVIRLYPSNWLYNAGVVGLLRVQEETGDPIESYLFNDGSFGLAESYFAPVLVGKKEMSNAIISLVNTIVPDDELGEWLTEKNQKKYEKFKEDLNDFAFRFIRGGNKLFASKTPYQNLVQLSEWQSYEFPELVRKIPELIKYPVSHVCDLCRENPTLVEDSASKLQVRLGKLQSTHLKGLGPSIGEFPNGFWNMNE
ncbi:MAG: hypothetical protein ACP5MI_11785, partial [Candidatus Kryptoniota bacterium]